MAPAAATPARLALRQLPHEITDLDDELADHGEAAQRLDADGAGTVIGEERGAGQPRLAVDGHSAAPADAHPAGPAVRQRAVELILDVVQAVQDRPLLVQRDLVLLRRRLQLTLRPVTRHLQDDVVRHDCYLPYTRSAGGQRVILTGRYSTRGAPSALR